MAAMINIAWRAWTKAASLEYDECIVSKENTNDKMLRQKDKRKVGGVAQLGVDLVKKENQEMMYVLYCL